MAGSQHSAVILHQLKHRLYLRQHLAVPGNLHAAVQTLAHLLPVSSRRLGRQPDHLSPQFQSRLRRHRIDAAHHLVQSDTPKHGKIVITAMDDLIVAIAEVGPIHGCPLVGLDHNSPGSDPDSRLHQLNVIVGPLSQIRVGVNVHVDDALQ